MPLCLLLFTVTVHCLFLDSSSEYASNIGKLLSNTQLRGIIDMKLLASIKSPVVSINSNNMAPKFKLDLADQTGRCYNFRLKQSCTQSEYLNSRAYISALGGMFKKKYSKLQKAVSVCFNEKGKFPLAALNALSTIDYVESDGRISSMQVQDDAPWGLWRISSKNHSISDSYVFKETGKNVNVYVLDSGVSTSHPEFDGRAKIGHDFVRTPGEDCAGHGTQVSSIIAGKNVGVAKRANIIAVKILDCQGEGMNSDLISAIHWVIENHQKPAVINLSVGGPESFLIDEAVRLALKNNIPVVVAAGNSKEDACSQSPSNTFQALTVAASNEADERARFSNFGKCVDLFAPGVGILCASKSDKSNRGYTFSSGTSMAAPFVAGVIAQMLEKNPKSTLSSIHSLLFSISAKKVLNPLTLSGSPNILIQSVPSSPSDKENVVDLSPSSSLPWRPTDQELPAAVEFVIIGISTLLILPASIVISLLYYLKSS